MASLGKVYIARLVGLTVLGPDGESIGRIRDVVVARACPPTSARPRLAVELPTRRRDFRAHAAHHVHRAIVADPGTGCGELAADAVASRRGIGDGQIVDSRVRSTIPTSRAREIRTRQ